ncbi:floral homeotic protein agamous [Quercus suber]|uniref:Floral homeotic protein agamous n=1 Tax=Quercus suber TaxID=58331 RepID=A0AAW0LB72_QUESU
MAETANRWLDEIKVLASSTLKMVALLKSQLVKSTIERYKKACADSSNTGSVAEANTQFYQQESAKLRVQIGNLQNSNRQMMGESLSNLTVKELKSLESKLERGISKIRSKKNELLFAEIEYMQKREVELHNNNQLLRAKIAENERNQQNLNVMPAGGGNYEFMQTQQYDSRNFFQVNALQPNHQYPREDQMSLQLV